MEISSRAYRKSGVEQVTQRLCGFMCQAGCVACPHNLQHSELCFWNSQVFIGMSLASGGRTQSVDVPH